jgi:DNA-binding transcriptional regulator YhcF (GntR family)
MVVMTGQPVDQPTGAPEADFRELAIDRKADVPIGVQLAWALRSRIGDGQLAPGQRLPGLRDLAEATGVNVNTVRAVYQRLEREGYLDSQQGSGTFVVPTPRRTSAVGTIAASAAREALEIGVDAREVAAALYSSPEPPARGDRGEGAERRHLLRSQIGALERTLAEMEAEYPGIAPAPTGKQGAAGPMLLGAEELERVRTQLVRRLASVQSAIDALLAEDDASTSDPVAPRPRPRASTQPEPAGAPEPKRSLQPRGATRPAPAGA